MRQSARKNLSTAIYVRVATNQLNHVGQTLIYKGLSFFCGVHNATESPISMSKRGVICMEQNETQEQIILSPAIQESILKFFMKTSIPRKAKEERQKKALAEERQEQS